MAQIFECRAYRTSDGELHNSKSEAVESEFDLSVLRFVYDRIAKTEGQITPKRFAGLIKKDLEVFRDILNKYSAARNRLKKKVTEQSPPSHKVQMF